MGVAGVGKSTLARKLLERLRAVYLDNNHVADAFFPDSRCGPEYENLRPSFYRILYTIAEENLKLGMSVLMDVPHVREMQDAEWRRFVVDLARRNGSTLVIVHCACPEHVVTARLVERAAPRDRAKLGRWEEFMKSQPIDVAIPLPHLKIDTTGSVEANAERTLDYIVNVAGPPDDLSGQTDAK